MAPRPDRGRTRARWRAGALARIAATSSALLASLPVATAATSWSSLGPSNRGGRALALALVSPDGLWVGTAGGGPWWSPDGGTTWEPRGDGLLSPAVGGVAVDPANPDLVVLGTGEGSPVIDRIPGVGILRSTDAGATWSATDLVRDPSEGHGFHVVRAGPNGTFLAGATDGLWRSSDGGQTWTAVRTGGDYYDVAWKPGDPDRVYTCKGNAASGNNVKVSTDDGITWTKAGTGQPPSVLFGKSKLAVSGSTVYCLVGEPGVSGGIHGLLRSTDDGATWTQRAGTGLPFGQSWFNLACAADLSDPETVIAGALTLARSIDGGSTFTSIGSAVHSGHHDLAYRSSDDVAVATSGGLWTSSDAGDSWTDRNQGLVTSQIRDLALAQSVPDFLLASVSGHGIDRRLGAPDWLDGLDGVQGACAIDAGNANRTFAAGSFAFWRSFGAGAPGTWSIASGGLSGAGLWLPPLALDRHDGDHLYTGTDVGTFRTTSAGLQWSLVSPDSPRWISISPVDGNVVWSVTGTAVRRTTDDGATWTTAAAFGFPAGAPGRVLAHPTWHDAALVTFSTIASGLARMALTTDGGGSWSDASGNLPDGPVNAIAVDPLGPERWWAGTGLGVWATTDGGATWSAAGTGLPNAKVTDLEIHETERALVAATFGRGAWEIGIPTATGADPIRASVEGLRLDPPWPSPGRDAIRLRWSATSEGEVELAIFDLQGRLVERIERRPRGDGVVRQATWRPGVAASGVYFARLRADGREVGRKLVVKR